LVRPGRHVTLEFTVANRGRKDIFLYADRGGITVDALDVYRNGKIVPTAPVANSEPPPSLPMAKDRYVLLRGRKRGGGDGFRDDSVIRLSVDVLVPTGEYDRIDIPVVLYLRFHVVGGSDLVVTSKRTTLTAFPMR
jgi:hypothetical protein